MFRLPVNRLYIVLPALVVLAWLATRNRVDPVWLEAGRQVRQPAAMLGDAPDSLLALYHDFHRPESPVPDSLPLRLVSDPTLPVIEWTEFSQFFRTLCRDRWVVLSGVTGTGATNLAGRAARLLAGGEPGSLMEINCAPQFDLELHKKYIGHEEATSEGLSAGRFMPGQLLQFWDRCRARPDRPFVAVIDNFDKINPETFFGPELWEALSHIKGSTRLGDRDVVVPSNFYLISVTHLGPGSRVEFNEEHFKRLGRPFILHPSGAELLAHLRRVARRLAAAGDPAAATQEAALRDTALLQRFLFYFLKTNEMIGARYAAGYQIGPGSNVRRLHGKNDLAALCETFINHVNSLKPERPLQKKDFAALDYTVANDGLEPGSNYVSRQIQFLQDTGYFVEITMVAATALLTALVGWWMLRRREQLIRRYGDRAQQVFNAFEKQQLTAEAGARRLEDIKKEVNQLVLQRQLNYTEGLYFLAFIEDKVRRIEFARSVSEHFLELFNTFMEDDILTEGEYTKLLQFLQSMRHKIPEEAFDRFRDKVEQAFAAGIPPSKLN